MTCHRWRRKWPLDVALEPEKKVCERRLPRRPVQNYPLIRSRDQRQGRLLPWPGNNLRIVGANKNNLLGLEYARYVDDQGRSDDEQRYRPRPDYRLQPRESRVAQSGR